MNLKKRFVKIKDHLQWLQVGFSYVFMRGKKLIGNKLKLLPKLSTICIRQTAFAAAQCFQKFLKRVCQHQLLWNPVPFKT